MSPLAEYDERKAEARQAMAEQAGGEETVALQKSVSNLFRHDAARRKLNLGSFQNVLHIDRERQTVDVEGRVTYEALVAATLPHGFLPPVVPQLKTITVGGAISGGGIEASSFRHGFVHESVEELDVLLSDGSVVTCRPDNEHSALFFGIANSYGTLGYILRARLPLVPARKFVRLRHERYQSAQDCFARMEEVCRAGRENQTTGFVDGVVFSGNELYLTQGDFVDEAPFVSNYRFMQVFYRSIRERKEDYLTTEDFIWRWDTDWFWCAKAFGMEFPPLRAVFGVFGLLRSPVYWKMRDMAVRSGLLGFLDRRRPREDVIQDVEVPISAAPGFLDFLLQRVGVLPIWLCPAMAPHADRDFPLYRMDPNELYVNFGFWGRVPRQGEEGRVNRLIEQKVQELGGRKSLYSTSYFPEDEFWRAYNREAYERLKDRYDPKRRLRDLYQKCVGGSSG